MIPFPKDGAASRNVCSDSCGGPRCREEGIVRRPIEKKPRGGELTAAEKRADRQLGRSRVRVKHALHHPLFWCDAREGGRSAWGVSTRPSRCSISSPLKELRRRR